MPPEVEPVTASCPREELVGTWSFSSAQQERSIALYVLAENWVGRRVFTPTHVVRFETP